MEHIVTIGALATDSKDRPLSPVVIAHCGELELRKAPIKSIPKSQSPAIRSDASSPPRRRKKTPVSEDDVSAGSEEEYRRRKREKKERKEREREERRSKKVKERESKEETVEELDARLEREEKERLEQERLEKLDAARKAREQAAESGGVVFKGRGAMRYRDPETFSSRSVPSNYNSRLPDARPRHPRGGPPRPDAGGRWERGAAARPAFNREKLDSELDRYSVKRKDGANGNGGGRDFDDWRNGRKEIATDSSRERSPQRRSASPARRISPAPAREASPPLRAESPLRGDRDGSERGSDMEMDADD
ncbi:hypothetical protein BCR39DRAFT_308505 [Naematelia encephala]|uniref:Uncharacterized protein n=1 Tax=Naematelia encephala TaxID=71784 RepID=A0A1Y2ARF5_9TREE|nr:hypothetical protein BCR39DRAFT_308505 [Naematelia encephala]